MIGTLPVLTRAVNSGRTRHSVFPLVAVAVALVAAQFGCAHLVENQPSDSVTPVGGYRMSGFKADEQNSDELFVILAFSGGGTRAAALAFGVLEELADTWIKWRSRRVRLLDEVDVISSVSGGSLTAAYYALHREETFTSFPDAVLYRNLQGSLVRRLFNPLYWPRLASSRYSRSELAADFFERTVFKGTTYADLLANPRRPFVILNATDLARGTVFPFTQDSFDLLCSDLSRFPIARAVTASAAFPGAFPPLALKNYAGRCVENEPSWVALSLAHERPGSYRFRQADTVRSYLDAERPFVHLADGGISDNLGLREPLAAISSLTSPWSLVEKLNNGRIQKLVVIVVNAGIAPGRDMDRYEKAPGILRVFNRAASAPMYNYSFDTIELLNSYFSIAERNRVLWLDVEHLVKESCPAASLPLPPPLLPEFYPVLVSFDAVADPAERKMLLSVETSFRLPAEAVNHIRRAGREVLRSSPEFRLLLEQLRTPDARP